MTSVDTSRPSAARIQNYLLGGEAHWTIDRGVADRALQELPSWQDVHIASRLLLRRVIRFLLARGVRQFIDVGAGIPDAAAIHRLVRDPVHPATRTRQSGRSSAARVVYVDRDPLAVAHCRAALARDGDQRRHAAVQADLRDPDELWTRVADTAVIDPRRPVALLVLAVLHFNPPDLARASGHDPVVDSMAAYRRWLPSGSYLAISHLSDHQVPPPTAAELAAVTDHYRRAGVPLSVRSPDGIRALFGDFTLQEPGLTWCPLWHPDLVSDARSAPRFPTPRHSLLLTGLARKA
ncbi:SAM-dependent methyltransferase [Saccharothrix hoggarensis]|uniref:SAM-dependent methyltransferase n=1 Tax=Saccharothrix hoggarensis TaxID=913853 RepID=A0ABW3QK61_9PSEU